MKSLIFCCTKFFNLITAVRRTGQQNP